MKTLKKLLLLLLITKLSSNEESFSLLKREVEGFKESVYKSSLGSAYSLFKSKIDLIESKIAKANLKEVELLSLKLELNILRALLLLDEIDFSQREDLIDDIKKVLSFNEKFKQNLEILSLLSLNIVILLNINPFRFFKESLEIDLILKATYRKAPQNIKNLLAFSLYYTNSSDIDIVRYSRIANNFIKNLEKINEKNFEEALLFNLIKSSYLTRVNLKEEALSLLEETNKTFLRERALKKIKEAKSLF